MFLNLILQYPKRGSFLFLWHLATSWLYCAQGNPKVICTPLARVGRWLGEVFDSGLGLMSVFSDGYLDAHEAQQPNSAVPCFLISEM